MSDRAIEVQGPSTKPAKISAIDQEVARFDEFFQRELNNEPMTGYESAILRTYLGWRLGLGKEANA